MTALRNFCFRKRAWISCGLVGILLVLGGFRLAAQPLSPGRPGIFLGAPTLEAPEPKKAVSAAALQAQPKDKVSPLPLYPAALPLGVPGPGVLFRLESEEEMRKRIRNEQKGPFTFPLVGGIPVVLVFPGRPIEFPDSRIVLSKTPFQLREWDPLAEVVEPYYTVYRRLYFEQINAERYGWDFGYMHPLIATGTFYFDFATLPFQFLAEPCRRYEYNSGYCLPGDPVPLLLYPPHPK